MNTEHCKALTSFYHGGLRCILHLTRYDVKDFHIHNEHVRNKMNVPDILDIVKRRQFNQLGKFSRLPAHRLPRQMLGAWVAHKRRPGRQFTTVRHSQVGALSAILNDESPIECVRDKGEFKDWRPMAENKREWETLSKNWIQRQQDRALYRFGHHFLLGRPC